MALVADFFGHLLPDLLLLFFGERHSLNIYGISPGVVDDPKADVVVPLGHMAAGAGGRPDEALLRRIDRPMQGRSVHLIVRPGQTRMAFLAGFRFAGLFSVEAMGGMAAVAFGLNIVASFAECLFERVGGHFILAVYYHLIPGNGMPPPEKLFIFFRMAVGADLGLHRRLFGPGFLMTLVAGDAVHARLGMLAVYPGLKDPPGVFLMAGQAVPDLFLRPQCHRGIEEEEENYR
jgi:hypothetical protein